MKVQDRISNVSGRKLTEIWEDAASSTWHRKPSCAKLLEDISQDTLCPGKCFCRAQGPGFPTHWCSFCCTPITHWCPLVCPQPTRGWCPCLKHLYPRESANHGSSHPVGRGLQTKANTADTRQSSAKVQAILGGNSQLPPALSRPQC